MTANSVSIGILGATGYTGAELTIRRPASPR
jgi:hypothetical protein